MNQDFVYRTIPNVGINRDAFLKHTLVREASDAMRWNRLNEDDKRELQAKVAESLFFTVKDKSSELEYDSIDKSGGDIEDMPGYDVLSNSIHSLQTMYASTKSAPSEVNDLFRCLTNLQKFKRYFTQAYAKGDEATKLLYRNMVVALIAGTSFMVATHVEYIKEPGGEFSAKLKTLRTMERSLFLDNIAKFNSMADSGQLKTFLDASSGRDNLVGMELVAVGVGAVAVVGLVLWTLREIVFTYFRFRVALSEELKMLALFVQLHSNSLAPEKKNVADKQRAIVDELNKWSDRIAVDQKAATKAAVADLSDADRGATMTAVSSAPSGNLL
jgi:hypothetical protein